MIRWQEDGRHETECETFQLYLDSALCVWCVRVVRGTTRLELGCRETVEEVKALAQEWLDDAVERAMLEALK